MAFRIDRQSRCAVIGYGSWATALVKILLENETSVGWYIRNREVLESVRRNETNPRYLRDVHFDTGRLRTSDDLNETVRSAEVIVLAVPSVYLKTTLEPLAEPLSDKFVISAIKGIVPGELVHVIADAHIYDRHIPLIEELITREEHPAPKVWLNPEKKDFYEFTVDDLHVEDYVTGPQIKHIPVAV